jgi:nucleoside-diphosphate-sugar epimerase
VKKKVCDKFLVLGATGHLGYWITQELERLRKPWKGTYRSPEKTDANFSDRFICWDAEDTSALAHLLKEIKPGVIINALGHPPSASEAEMRDFYIETTITLFNCIQEATLNCRVVMIGSAAEYGNTPEGGKSKEGDILRPLTAYGKVKAEQSRIACSYAEQGLNIVTGRVFNVIGPGQSVRLVAGSLFQRLINGERPLQVHACNYIRDWIDVRDAVRALVVLGETSDTQSVVNICGGCESTVEALAKEIVRLCSGILAPVPAPTCPEVLWHSAGDNSVIRSIGWKPAISMEQSLYDQWLSIGSPTQRQR